MESSLFVFMTFLLLLSITNNMAYDNLLEDPDEIVLIENGQRVNGTKIIIDGDTSTCLYIGRFYRTALYIDFPTVKSVYEVVVYLGITEGSWCDSGVFGENCTKNCSENCVGKSCDILNGKCLSGFCSDGWQGEDCNQKCYNGTYGPRCKSHCGNCTDMEYCDHVTGYCKGGCKDGSKGNKCDTACLDGTYGSNCKEKCGKCRGSKSCDKASGFCLNGCENGYFGEKCILQCPNGTYGYQCNSSCGNCKDRRNCDHETGYCKGGCAAGSMGVKCDEECPFGFYGEECSERCNLSCGYKSGQQSISEENDTCKLTSVDDYKSIAYALGAALTLSLLVNILLSAMCFIRFRLKKKEEKICGKPSPVYANVRGDHRQDKQGTEGMKIDQQNVLYEALAAPSQETHYDALQ